MYLIKTILFLEIKKGIGIVVTVKIDHVINI